jgi:hypothetical protein
MSFWSIEPNPVNTNPNPYESSFNIDAYVRTSHNVTRGTGAWTKLGRGPKIKANGLVN